VEHHTFHTWAKGEESRDAQAADNQEDSRGSDLDVGIQGNNTIENQ